MFATVKENVNILQVIADLTQQEVIECGSENYELESKSCPYCNHNDCFRIKHDENDPSQDFAHCFSCGFHGDVIEIWASFNQTTNEVKPRELWKKPSVAAREIAKEYGIELVSDYSPVQEILDLAARYYHNLLMDPAAPTYEHLRGMSPKDYQNQVRAHSDGILDRLRVGWSDGRLCEFLTSLGISDEMMVESGVARMNRGTARDFLPSNVFIYPGVVRGRVSHLTFKDPLKQKDWQLPKKNTLNGYLIYNQDSVADAEVVIVVEGENDVAAVLGQRIPGLTAIGTQGQVSRQQYEWMAQHLADKLVITLFDNDDAGNGYRDKMASYCLPAIKKLYQMTTAEFEVKDIDEAIRNKGLILETFLADHEKFKAVKSTLVVARRGGAPVATRPSTAGGLATNPDDAGADIEVNQGLTTSDGEPFMGVSVRAGRYFKTKVKDGNSFEVPLTDFTIDLRYVFVREDQRTREIVIVKASGMRSMPIQVTSSAKVSLKEFKVLIANAADATFYGNESDLSDLWEYLFAATSPKIVHLPFVVGALPEDLGGGWLFADEYLTSSGATIAPDKNGVFWLTGELGIKPASVDSEEASSVSNSRMLPRIISEFATMPAEELEEGLALNLAKNFGNTGNACLLLSWARACAFSNMIFDNYGFFPFMFLFGRHGKGKTEILKWLLSIYDMREKSYITASSLKSAVGFSRLISFYASLPAVIDEIRNDEDTLKMEATYRGWYNRSGRIMGVREDNRVKIQTVRSCIAFGGEDVFLDPALKERCIQVDTVSGKRELVESYQWCTANVEDFRMIGRKWVLESINSDPKEVQKAIYDLNKKLVSEGVSARIAFIYAVIGVFGYQFAEQYYSGGDYKLDWEKFLVTHARDVFAKQKEQSTIMKFFERVESIQAEERSPIGHEQIRIDGNYMHIWFADIVRIVEHKYREKAFSEQALRKHIEEEPCYVTAGRQGMGMAGVRRRVITLDYTHPQCPETLQNIAHKAAPNSTGLDN